MIRRNYEYQIPDIKDLELVEGLTARLKDLWGEARENSYQIYLYAAGLRNRYLDKKTNKYSDDFLQWYEAKELTKLFGKISSFTKYASAGDVVNYIGQQYKNGKYIENIPLSRSSLYELSLLIDETTETQLEKLFFAGGDDNEPLIHPSATTSDFSNYRQGVNFKSTKLTKARKTKFSIPLATIYVSRDIYKFHKISGEHVGSVDLTDTEKLLKRMKSGLDTKLFDVRDNLEKISTSYEKKQEKADPTRKLRVAKAKKKK